MLLPSLTIHSIVKYTAKAIKARGVQNVRVKQWLPSALGRLSISSLFRRDFGNSPRSIAFLGLGFIPALPFLFDEPVEHVVDATFDAIHRKLYPDENSAVFRALNESHGPHEESVAEKQAEVKTVGGQLVKEVEKTVAGVDKKL